MGIFGIICIVYFVIGLIVFLSVLLQNTKGNLLDGLVLIIAAGMGALWPFIVFEYIRQLWNNE